jgi:hypothetical protein
VDEPKKQATEDDEPEPQEETALDLPPDDPGKSSENASTASSDYRIM